MSFATIVFGVMAFVAVAGASAVLVGVVVAIARRTQWLAIPNARSSHAVPTPSSGGIGIACVFLGMTAILAAARAIDLPLAIACIGGGVIVAVTGWCDDRRQLPATIRLAAYAAAAAWAVAWIGGMRALHVGVAVIPLGAFGGAIAFLAILGFSNLYNFMDGIDGLVGSLAVVAGGSLALLTFLAGAPTVAAILGMLAASACGFLIWNWHPAKIFMGDVGSVLLGFTFAVTAVASEATPALPSLLWVIILAPVVVDAGFTTIRRALRRERWWEAHRSFSYQRAVQVGHRHSTVVLGVLVLEVVLVGLAFIAWTRPILLPHALAMAITITTVVWAWYQWMPRPVVRV